ncbi:MAG TPA: cellulase family glycosylhydrolase [Gaiellaceae bacterium]
MLFAAALVAAAFAATARADIQMPIGFFDDNSFRWSPDRETNLQSASGTGASIIHTTASWPGIAPTRPANALNGNDPAYKLGDLDELVGNAAKYGLRVMIDINGTPKWANGGKTPNHLPKRLGDLTAFAHMLAARYKTVTLFSVWNEPNLGLFLTPQFAGKKIVGPANYAKLYKAAYAGIKAGDPRAQVAIGETSARGRDKPIKGVSDSIAPGTFARLLAAQKGLKFDAWAHHPYPTTPNMRPLQRVRYPNVTLSTLSKFESDLHKWFHRTVPVWITEYGHETKPGEPHGVSNSTQASYARQALTFARKDPNVKMFIWFTFRDSAGNPWQSGLEAPSGARKSSYEAFGSLARLIDGQAVSVKAGRTPAVKLYFPQLFYYQGAGGSAGMYWKVTEGAQTVGVGTPVVTFAPDQSLTIPLTGFTPVKKHTYKVTVQANESGGHNETESATIRAI